ncbi:hypothetical protein B8X00_08485 [Acetobacter fabarum]|uniref:Uncharacterized protein n=1 Tax=Acetobacter fabarum TaxID=483199 RepID=A0A269XXR7_9PROT|nr:hypothetical protein B8X00_08485 [Acetobacter fabarum]
MAPHPPPWWNRAIQPERRILAPVPPLAHNMQGLVRVRVRPPDMDLSKRSMARQASTFMRFDAASSCIAGKTLLAA